MLTQLQDETIKAIVNVFETGSVLGDYGNVTLLRGDRGGLTYGRSQTTINSGGLFKLIDRYAQQTDGLFARDFTAFLKPLKAISKALEEDVYFTNLLRAAADDPLMRETQDSFFDDAYFAPAGRIADRRGIETALGCAVVYDSTVHGSWGLISQRTDQASGKLSVIGEHRWIAAYVKQRRQWLAGHSNKILNPTVYRMDAFQRLIDGDLWGLETPLAVRGKSISRTSLNGVPRGVFAGPALGSRIIKLTPSLQRGLDVRRVQLALSKPGNDFSMEADGFYGRLSSNVVKEFQLRKQLPISGEVTATEFAALGLKP